jgi:hypothetical protein
MKSGKQDAEEGNMMQILNTKNIKTMAGTDQYDLQDDVSPEHFCIRIIIKVKLSLCSTN